MLTPLRRLGSWIGVGLGAVFEVAALAAWFTLTRTEPFGELSIFLAGSLLAAGLLLASLVTFATVNGFRRSLRGTSIAIVAGLQTVLWMGWYALVSQYRAIAVVAAAGLALAFLLVPLRTMEGNVLRRAGLFSRTFDPGTVLASVFVVVGATTWLALVTGLVSATTLLVDLGLQPISLSLAGVGWTVPAAAQAGVGVMALCALVDRVDQVRSARRARAATREAASRAASGDAEETADESESSSSGLQPIRFHQD